MIAVVIAIRTKIENDGDTCRYTGTPVPIQLSYMTLRVAASGSCSCQQNIFVNNSWKCI